MGEEAAQPILGIAPLEDGLWFIAEAAFDLAQQEGMDTEDRSKLAGEMGRCAQLPTNDPLHLRVRHIGSRLPLVGDKAKGINLGVYPADVNAWLNACGVPYRWRRESPTKHHDQSPSISSTSLTSSDVPASSDAEETPQERRQRRIARFEKLGGQLRKAGDGWHCRGKRGVLAKLIQEEATANRPMSDKSDVRRDLIAAKEAQLGEQ